MALFTLNILNFSKNEPIPCFQKHWSNQEIKPEIQVRWKDPITGQWKGPNPLLTMGRGFGCIFPIGDPSPIWVPARNLKFTPQERGQISKSDTDYRDTYILSPRTKSSWGDLFFPFRSSMQRPWWTLLLVIVGLPILSLLTIIDIPGHQPWGYNSVSIHRVQQAQTIKVIHNISTASARGFQTSSNTWDSP